VKSTTDFLDLQCNWSIVFSTIWDQYEQSDPTFVYSSWTTTESGFAHMWFQVSIEVLFCQPKLLVYLCHTATVWCLLRFAAGQNAKVLKVEILVTASCRADFSSCGSHF